jgi:hypothetical protein
MNLTSKAALDQEVLLGMTMSIQRDVLFDSTYVCSNVRSQMDKKSFIERYLPQTSYCQVFKFFP